MSTTLAPFIDEPAPAPQFRALDLTGPLTVPEFLRELATCTTDAQRDDAQSALLHLIQGVGESLREQRFRLGDAALTWLALEETRDRPTDRGRALTDLAEQSGVEYALLSECFAVARAFPYGPERDRYPDRLWSWFVNLVRRTALPGERWGDGRQERIQQFAAECAELGPSAARRYCEERVGQLVGQQAPATVLDLCAATLPGSEGRLVGERPLEPQNCPPQVDTHVLERLARLEGDWKRLQETLNLERLETRFLAYLRKHQPGSFPVTAQCMREFLGEELQRGGLR